MIPRRRSFPLVTRRKLVVACCALATLLLTVLPPSSVPRAAKAGAAGLQGAGAGKGAPSCCGGEEGENKPHTLAGSYYTLKDGFAAKLLLNNKGPHPVEVRPTLYSMSGERFAAPALVVEGNTHRFVNLTDWVTAAGEQFREGSIQVFHRGKDLVLGAQIYLTDDAHSLSFEEKMNEPATAPLSPAGGVWWLPSPRGAVGLVVSNTTDLALSVTAKVRGASPRRETDATFALAPHETKVFDVQRDLTGKVRGAMSAHGYLSVESDGPPGSVLARAMAHDDASGYSLPVQFSYTKAGKSNSLQGAGLRIGSAGGEELRPLVVAHNAGDAATTLNGRVPYTTADGTDGEVALPRVELAPGQTEVIDVAQALAAHGVRRGVTTAGLEFEHTGESGSVVTSAFSVSRSGNQVFRVPLWDIAAQRSATGGYPWYIEGDSTTVVYIKNVTDQPQQYNLQLRYDGGVYALGLKTVEAGQTVMHDIRALRDQQVPDASGHTLPPDASSGQVNWSMRGPRNQVLIGRSEQVDVARGVSSNYACMNCCPDSFAGGWVDPGGVEGFATDTTQFSAFEQSVNCYGSLSAPYNPWPWWDSTDQNVATCDGGMATAVGPGEAHIQAHWMGYEWGSFESGNPNECYERPIEALGDALCDVLDSAQCTIEARGSGGKSGGNILIFPPPGDQSLGLQTSGDRWKWHTEIKGTVPDDVSTWSLLQSYTGRRQRILRRPDGSLEPMTDDPLNVPDDSPDSAFRQQPPGDTVFFWIDGPGHTKTVGSSPVHYLKQVQNFTSIVRKGRRACRVTWSLRLEVENGVLVSAGWALGRQSF
jgi:hypothetical protein